MNLQLTNKIVVITGGAKGIGFATVQSFFQEGATVFILDIDPIGAESAEEFPERVIFIKCDLSSEPAVKRAFETIEELYGKIDILVNNAAAFKFAPVLETTNEMLDLLFSVNLKSYFFCAKHAIPLLKNSANAVIVNLSSGVAFQYQANMAAYATTKTAILGLTRSLSVDYAPWLRSVAVCPGATLTPSLQIDIDAREGAEKQKFIKDTESINVLNRLGKAEEIADFIVFISSPKAAYCNGHAYRVDGGIGIKIEGAK
jgi:NAD(P)-dependent dehydrogenase (short-subunit alcohol dehydrogenase family)